MRHLNCFYTLTAHLRYRKAHKVVLLNFVMLLEGYQNIGLLALRAALGIVFVAHGWGKIQNPRAWAKALGYPTLVGLLVSIGEFFGGLGVLVGFLTAYAALGPLFVMLGALYHHIILWKHPLVTQNGKGYELPLTLLLLAAAVALLGPGAYSLDVYLGW